MRDNSRVGKIIYGVLFLAIGLLWLSVIYIRCDGYLPRKKAQEEASHQKIQEQLTERLLEVEQMPMEHKRGFPLYKYVPKMVVLQFWAIACWELVCALLFLLSGIALLRGYPVMRHYAIYTLIADIILKTLVVTYHYCLLIPLKTIFDGKNILFMYFTPDDGLLSKASSYLAGVTLIQRGVFYYGFFYALFLIVSLGIFTHPKTKKYFQKK